MPPAGYVALVCIYLFAGFFQWGWGPVSSPPALAYEDVLADAANLGVLDLRLGNSGCTTPWSQCGLRSSDAVALQSCHRKGGAQHAGHNVSSVRLWVENLSLTTSQG